MDTAEVLARALDAAVADVEPDGDLILRRRIRCIHDAQVELAGLLAGELGESGAVAALRLAAARTSTVIIADYLSGAADLLADVSEPPTPHAGGSASRTRMP
jgi:hypothetical protein